jgi:lipopolysaccharide transport system ATP-binding protein
MRMNAAVLGYSPREFEARRQAIVDFAEIGDFIRQPVKTYSSGMMMRLAFSVIVHLEPELLIVDEALAVGDAYFQHKCFAKLRELRDKGVSFLIATHDPDAIRLLCDRVLMLQQGHLVRDGPPNEVLDYYNALLAGDEAGDIRVDRTSGEPRTVSGTGEATVTGIRLLDATGAPREVLDVGALTTVEVAVRVHRPIPRLVLGIQVRDRLGRVIFGTNTHYTGQPLVEVDAGDDFMFSWHFPMNLGPGSYSISTALVSTETHLVNNYEWKDLACVFEVSNISRTHFVGCCWLQPEIAIEHVSGKAAQKA